MVSGIPWYLEFPATRSGIPSWIAGGFFSFSFGHGSNEGGIQQVTPDGRDPGAKVPLGKRDQLIVNGIGCLA
jgi:hypothetical protein